MTYAHVTDGQVDAVGNPPDVAYDGTRWWDLRTLDPAVLARVGWLPLVTTDRPADTDTTTWERSVTIVAGVPTVTWTERPWTAEELAAQAQAVDRVAALEAVVLGNLPEPADGEEPTFADLTARQAGAIFAGQKFVWTGGNVWQASLGPMNSQATPDTYPQGYAQLTGLPPDVAPWTVGESVTVGDLREYGGITYRCLQAHTTQAGWTPPAVPALWTPQG